MNEYEIDLKEILAILVRHVYLFAAIVVIIMTFTVAHIYRSVKIYSATVSIEIEPQATNILGKNMEFVQNGSQGAYWTIEKYYATQYEIIKSRAVAQKALEMAPGENLLEYLGLDLSKIPPEKIADIDPIDVLLDKITVAHQKDSNIVKISIEDKEPAKAAFLANSVANAYIEFNLEKKYFETKDAARWLMDQSVNLKKSLEDSELTLFEFKQNNNVLSTTFEAKQDLLSSRIIKLSNILTDQEIKRNALSARIEEYAHLVNVDNLDEGFLKEVSQDNKLIDDLKLKYLEALSKIYEAEKFYGEKHPKVIGLVAEKENLKDSLKHEIAGVIDSYDLELKTLENEMQKNRKMLLEAQKEAIALNKLDINYNKLRRDVETNKKLYDIVLERSKQADLSTLLRNNNVRMIDAAWEAKRPIKPKKLMILLIGFFISIIIASAAIFVVEFFDTKFKNFKELELITNKPLLGVIPKFAHLETGDFKEIVFEKESKENFAIEAFRSLRTNIKLSNPDQNLNVMVVTSPLPQEGKTFVSLNLAVGYSVAGKRVLVVDADMRRPRVHKVMNLKNEKGLSTLIVGEYAIAQTVNKNVYDNLDIITAGPIPPNPAELLESGRFSNVLAELRKIYDLVIFDTPPLSLVSDAAIIAPSSDGVVMSVNIGKTPRDIFKLAIEKITKPSVNLLGVIVNNFDFKQEKRFKSYHNYSYYHSSYYHSHYYNYKADKDEKTQAT